MEKLFIKLANWFILLALGYFIIHLLVYYKTLLINLK